jgi:hypothetical protein
MQRKVLAIQTKRIKAHHPDAVKTRKRLAVSNAALGISASEIGGGHGDDNVGVLAAGLEAVSVTGGSSVVGSPVRVGRGSDGPGLM